MATRPTPLTVRGLTELRPTDTPYKRYDSNGLFVLVHPNGSKYFRFKYRFGGAEKQLSLGVFGPLMSLKQARDAALAAKALLKSGQDPAAVRRTVKTQQRDRAALTVRTVGDSWLGAFEGRLSPPHIARLRRSLEKDVIPRLGNRPIAEITRADVRDCVLAIVNERDVRSTAQRVLQRIRALLEYALQMGWVDRNVAEGLRGIVQVPRVQHRARLKESELARFWNDLDLYRARGRPETCIALELIIHTAVRTRELLEADWSEIDLERKLWLIPGHRMKMRIAHSVPLSAASVALFEKLRELAGTSRFVLPSVSSLRKPMSNNTLIFAMQRMGYQSKATVHGFRGVFSTWANGNNVERSEVIELQLGHRERNHARAAYNDADLLPERRRLMDKWSSFLLSTKAAAHVG